MRQYYTMLFITSMFEMLSDGTKAKEVEDKVQTLDMIEILEKSL